VVPFVLSMGLCTFLFPPEVAHVAIFCQLFSDPFASTIGILFGRHQLIDSRTLEGTLACFLMSSFIAWTILSHHYPENLSKILLISLVSGVVTALAELFPIKGVD